MNPGSKPWVKLCNRFVLELSARRTLFSHLPNYEQVGKTNSVRAAEVVRAAVPRLLEKPEAALAATEIPTFTATSAVISTSTATPTTGFTREEAILAGLRRASLIYGKCTVV
jgi:hypothetical protein